MKKQGRAKSIARWTAWVLAVLFPAMWVFTCWGDMLGKVQVAPNHTCVGAGLTNGLLFLGTDDGSGLLPSFCSVHRYPLIPSAWWPYANRLPSGRSIWIPLWMPWLVALGFSIRFYRDHQRDKKLSRIGCCTACGYDRSGLASTAPCPECAAAHTPP